MREIIFRGKRLNNGEWIEGSLCTTIPSDENFYTISYFDFEGYYIEEKVIPSTIGQYTGLTDKNGKKIFEGDIVSERPPMNTIAYIGKVVWDEEMTLFRVVFDTPSNCCILGTYSRSYTVIGNIYDNPELLK